VRSTSAGIQQLAAASQPAPSPSPLRRAQVRAPAAGVAARQARRGRADRGAGQRRRACAARALLGQRPRRSRAPQLARSAMAREV